MIWNGREIVTAGDVVDSLVACTSREEAQRFLSLYESVNPHARDNVGYCTGHMRADDAVRIKEWLGVEHPLFKGNPSPAELVRIGVKLGELTKKHGVEVALQMMRSESSPWFMGALE